MKTSGIFENILKQISTMKTKIFTLFSLLLLLSCNTKEYKFKIYNPNYLEHNKPAVFFTDTLEWKSDTVFYTNTDKTIVIISIDSLKDCKIDTLK